MKLTNFDPAMTATVRRFFIDVSPALPLPSSTHILFGSKNVPVDRFTVLFVVVVVVVVFTRARLAGRYSCFNQ